MFVPPHAPFHASLEVGFTPWPAPPGRTAPCARLPGSACSGRPGAPDIYDPVQPQVVRVLWIGLVVDPHHRVHALAALPVAEHLDRRPRSDEAFPARTIDQQDLDPGLVLELSGPPLDAIGRASFRDRV